MKILSALIAVVVVAGMFWWYMALPIPTMPGQGGVECTEEAKICPDGSAVGRTGPNCEFAACPSIPVPTPQPQEPGGGVACTADAMQCPDGSWVGRSGPNCQFVCPSGGTTVTRIETGINQSANALGVTVTPLEVTEDSRCPVDVQCVWAGTMRVRTQLKSGLGTSENIFEIGTSVTTEAEVVTLVEVLPLPKAGVPIPKANYRFVFEVKKR